jgi:hypothetical protein
MHIAIEPSILYLGTPVVLITTLNDDATPNIAPMSSAWWLGWNCMLGLGAKGHTAANLLRERECVLNLPSIHNIDAVNRLARTTGSDPVPPHKQTMGYTHIKDKFTQANLTSTPSDLVSRPALRNALSSSKPFSKPITPSAIAPTSPPPHSPSKSASSAPMSTLPSSSKAMKTALILTNGVPCS